METETTSLMRRLGFYANGWEAVLMTLESFYEMSLTFEIPKLDESSPEMLRNVLELVLAAVVQCEAKEAFVKDISSMDAAVQSGLMTIIARVMSQGARGEKEEEEKETNEALGRHSRLYLTRYAALPQKRENKALKEKNVREVRAYTRTKEPEADGEWRLILVDPSGSRLTQTMKKCHEIEVEKEKW